MQLSHFPTTVYSVHNTKPRTTFLFRLLVAVCAFLTSITFSANAAMLTFNSSDTSYTDERDAWLGAIGISDPQYLVDFETGFIDGQNISGVTGLFSGGLIITDTSNAAAASIEADNDGIGGSNPIGSFALEHNEQKYLVLDFSSNPVDYIGFNDIDHTGTDVVVSFVGGSTATTSFEGTGASGDSAEFFAIFRNDMPQITKVELDASGDGTWGIDNLEYGVVPVPAAAWLFGFGLLGLIGIARKKA